LKSPVYIYFAIFAAKLVEVSISTLRTVLNSRGQKVLGALIGFVEVALWLVIASVVLKDIQSDILKAFAYCLAYSFGNYIGVTIEEKLALGMSAIELLARKEDASELAETLREAGFGVTAIDSYGKENTMVILKMFLKRKRLDKAQSIIKAKYPNGVFSVSDVKTFTNGFIKK
jgi:uncharacterized protein YebE (UPF0316 family)